MVGWGAEANCRGGLYEVKGGGREGGREVKLGGMEWDGVEWYRIDGMERDTRRI